MIRKYIFLLAALLQSFFAIAQHRSESDAVSVAQEFWGVKRNALKAVSREHMNKARSRIAPKQGAAPMAAYYIVNDEANGRFVIVSCDERLYTILGYSNEGAFDAETAPESLIEMLADYDTQYQSIAQNLDGIRYADTRSATTAV